MTNENTKNKTIKDKIFSYVILYTFYCRKIRINTKKYGYICNKQLIRLSYSQIFDMCNTTNTKMNDELHTIQKSMSSTRVFCEVRVTQSLIYCVVFCRSLFVSLSVFILTIVLSVLRFTADDYPCGIFRLFFNRLDGCP